jgi:hypothetical protein
MRVLDDHPRLSAAITVLMAVAVLVMAWGSDPTSSARAAVGDATGPLVADSLTGGAILNARNMGPGDSVTGEITVTNVGDSAGGMTLGTSDLTDLTPNGGILSQTLLLTVLDVTAGRAPAQVFSGRLTDLHGAVLGDFEQGDAHRYRFIVTYPAGLGDDADNALQGSTARLNFVWTATGKSPPVTTPAPATPVDVVPDAANPVIVDHVEASTNPSALKLRVYVRRTQAAHRKRVYVNVFCNHRCTLTATGVASLPSKHKKWNLRALKGSVKKSQGTVKFKMPLPKKALGPLNTALLHRKKASVKLKIVAHSGTQIVRWTRTIHLAR